MRNFLCATLFLLSCSLLAGCGAKSHAMSLAGEARMDMQMAQLVEALKGKRVGLLTNATGVDGRFESIADRLHGEPGVNLVAFFAPEHGVRGDHQAGGGIQDYDDPLTGVPVFSLYGARRQPTAEQLDMLDVMVFDIQDVGSRFYTYVWTMTLAMEACAAAGKEFVVLDRPNPVGLDKVEGAPIRFNAGLVGRLFPDQPFGTSTRHGLTAGELAILCNEEWMSPKVALKVIPVPGLTRSMTFEETGYPWVMPSPNMPTLETALVYPGMCLFEGTNMSEGRGTTRPFELVGAPFINGTDLARELNALRLPGVRFRAAWFTPTFDDHRGELCAGIQVHVTDPETFDPIRTALSVLKTAYTLYPDDLAIRAGVSRLMGVENLHERIKEDSVETIMADWADDLKAFKALRAKHLIYPDR